LVAAMLLVSFAPPAFAQRDAGAKARGEFGTGFWASRRSDRSMRYARDYSRELYLYSRDAQEIEPQVAKSESGGLEQNIQSAKQDLDVVRKSVAKHADLLAAVAAVEKHLAAAMEVHKALHKECSQQHVNGPACMARCSEITKELERALAEHGALMRQMEMKAAASAGPEPPR
jgi:hypothetical protein